MSNYKAITGSSKIVHRNQGGGSKLQGIPSSTNLNTWAHVAFKNRNVVCPCNRDLIFCMNQLGGVGAGGIPGRSYTFAPTADGTHKQFYCGHRFVNGRWLIYPKYNIIAKYPDNVLFLIGSPASNANYTHVFFNSTLVIGNIYRVIINNKTIIFKVTKLTKAKYVNAFSNKLFGYIYKIDIINNYNIYNSRTYYSGKIYNSNRDVINSNDTSFQLSVQ